MEDSTDDRMRFVRAIGEVMKAIALDCQRNNEIDSEMYVDAAKEAYAEVSNNIQESFIPTEDDVVDGIMAEIDRERRFFQELSRFAQDFKQEGLVFRIESTTSGYTPGMYRDTMWNTGIAPQCNIRVGVTKNYIAAFPTGPAIAVAKSDQPATPIYASQSSILLLPQDEDLDAPTWEAMKIIFGEIEHVDIADVPGIISAKKGTGFLAIESNETFYGKDLEQLFNDFDAHVIFITSPADSTTTLHEKTSKDLSSSSMRLHYWAFPIFAMHEHGF